METRVLPGTDLELSVIGMGCWTIGGQWWGPVRDEESIGAVHAALDCGINWFDTAPLYGHGHADEVLVRALQGRRDVVIATKVGVRTGGEHAESDLSPAHVIADAEASLRRLGIEAIDLLQVHWPCERATPIADTIGALEELKRQGKVRYFGLCNYGAAELEQALDTGGVSSLQTPYSLLRREFEAELVGVCARRSVGALAYEPLCRGLLSGKFQSQPVFPESDMRSWDERFQGARFRHARRLLDDLARVSDKVGVSTAALAIGWVASRPGVTSVIAGARTAAQVRENAKAASILHRKKIWGVVSGIAGIHGGWPG